MGIMLTESESQRIELLWDGEGLGKYMAPQWIKTKQYKIQSYFTTTMIQNLLTSSNWKYCTEYFNFTAV